MLHKITIQTIENIFMTHFHIFKNVRSLKNQPFVNCNLHVCLINDTLVLNYEEMFTIILCEMNIKCPTLG